MKSIEKNPANTDVSKNEEDPALAEGPEGRLYRTTGELQRGAEIGPSIPCPRRTASNHLVNPLLSSWSPCNISIPEISISHRGGVG